MVREKLDKASRIANGQDPDLQAAKERQQELVADISKEDLVSTEEFIPMAKKVTMQYDGRGQVIRDDSRREPVSGSA